MKISEGNIPSNRVHAVTLSRRARRSLLLALESLALILLNHSARAQGWSTVDDFPYLEQGAYNAGLTLAPNGNLFGAGFGDYSLGYRGLVRASADGGNTWSLLDDFLYPGLNYTVFAGMVSDSAGNMYVAGTAYDDGSADGGPFHWIVRRSTDGGATWSIVDDFVPGGQFTQPNGITVDAAGNVYVTGDADYNTGNNYWTVRKGVGGVNFTTVDSVRGYGFYNTAWAVFVHPTAGIFAAGEAPVVVNKFGGTALEWTVRRSTNGGAAWATVDTFVLPATGSSIYRAEARGIGADALGNLYVVGRAAAQYKGSGYFHWVVRKGVNGGASWTTDDNYAPNLQGTQKAMGFAANPKTGDLYVGGGTGPNWWAGDTEWIIRKKAVGSSTWINDDDFKFGSYSGAQAITANGSGNIFVGGSGSAGTSSHWLVRKK